MISEVFIWLVRGGWILLWAMLVLFYFGIYPGFRSTLYALWREKRYVAALVGLWILPVIDSWEGGRAWR